MCSSLSKACGFCENLRSFASKVTTLQARRMPPVLSEEPKATSRSPVVLDIMATETVTIPMAEYELMVSEIETLRRTDLYKRLLQFVQNIHKNKFTRADLGF